MSQTEELQRGDLMPEISCYGAQASRRDERDATSRQSRRYRRRSGSSRSRSSLSDSPPREVSRSKKLTTKELRSLRDAIIEEKFGYNDEANPFGDANLSRPFVWEKKEKLLRAVGKSKRLENEAYLEQTAAKIKEIERVRKRRKEREEEEKLLEIQQAALARERELENYEQWAAKEEAFYRDMEQRRADIRIRGGRAKTSDLFVKALRLLDGDTFDDLSLPPAPPHLFFATLSDEEARNLLDDVQTHCEICRCSADDAEASSASLTTNWAKSMEKPPTDEGQPSTRPLKHHGKFWEAMRILGQERLGRQQTPCKTNDSDGKSQPRDMTTGLATAALEELRSLLSRKTEQQLEDMEPALLQRLRGIRRDPTSQEDPTYWETVAEMLPYYKAVAVCRSVYEQAVARAAAIEQERRRRSETTGGGDETSNRTQFLHQSYKGGSVDTDTVGHHQEDDDDHHTTSAGGGGAVAAVSRDATCRPPKRVEPFWPVLLPMSRFRDSASALLTPEEFDASRQQLKKKVVTARRESFLAASRQAEQQLKAAQNVESKDGQSTLQGESSSAKSIYEQFVRQEQMTMGDDEFVMTPAYEVSIPQNAQAPTPSQSPEDWEAKYRLRKPRFFNHVKTGYEWSKYNQTHYDRDNPPPKAIQGYKFNIFYSDLIDPTVTPTWRLRPGDTPDTVFIQFHAGPPYEDIRFRIINREWDLHPRSGFRNVFERGRPMLF